MTIFVALDTETTGTNPQEHSLIQIGVTSLDFTSSLRMEVCPTEALWDLRAQPEALEVNGFTKERIEQGAEPDRVDALLAGFLRSLGAEDGSVVPVGFNVGSFDMAFVRRTLPRSARLFHYRSVELNSIVFLYSEADGRPYADLKAALINSASRSLGTKGFEIRPHDALFDARLAAQIWTDLVDYAAA